MSQQQITKTKSNRKSKQLSEFVILEDDEEYEAPECFGKHCSNTNNLNLGKCWNRYKQCVTDELICEECWEQNTKIECVACCESFTYDKVKLKPEIWPWGSCLDGPYSNFFCQGCIKDITEGVESGRYGGPDDYS